MQPSVFAAACAFALGFSAAVKWWLARRQIRAAQIAADSPPPIPEMADSSDPRRAADYAAARLNNGIAATLAATFLALILTVGGGLSAMDNSLDFFGDGIVRDAALLIAAAILLSAAALPFEWRGVFGVEKRFGFNRMTPRIFIADKLKETLVGIALGGPLALAILALMRSGGEWWWICVWGIWAIFNLAVAAAYPALIAPIFNRFRSLDDESLRTRLSNRADQSGFPAREILVMDGSKRSRHSNAYFAGFGRARRIVLFDTLLDLLTDGEIEAVLTHEIGHFKLRHIFRRIALAFIAAFFGLAIFALIAESAWFYAAFDLRKSPGGALILLSLLSPAFLFPLRPILSMQSRRFEFQADAFAAKRTGASPLISALVKLYRDNAAVASPDKIYSAFYDSHPPAKLRISRLRQLESTNE